MTFIGHYNIVAFIPKISARNDSKDLIIVTVINSMAKLGIVIALGGRKSGTLMRPFYF